MHTQKRPSWKLALLSGFSVLLVTPSWAQTIEAEIFPEGRAVQVGNLATAFLTVTNTGTTDAVGCTIQPLTPVPGALFIYAPVDTETRALSGPANTPVDIPVEAAQIFNITFVPSVASEPLDIQFDVTCSNTAASPIGTGLNTLLLSASDPPIPDIVALTSAPKGILVLPSPTSAEAFLIASLNLGAGDNMTMFADSGAASLPVVLLVCEFDASQGTCLADPSPTTTRTINTGEVTFYAVFAQGQGTAIPPDRVANRIFARWRGSDGIIRGLVSVPVETDVEGP